MTRRTFLLALPAALGGRAVTTWARQSNQSDLDARVTRFLAERRGTWRDMNVPESDGRMLHEIVVQHRYTKALEIGTSTGHSGIWIGWALAKTGGRLITVEIDAGRHREAVANFRAAGLADVIDTRLADAHDLVPKLPGPFDFVFIDADKDWYTNYAKAVLPKLKVGGCLAAHNVYPNQSRWWGRGGGGYGTSGYYDYVSSQPYLDTSVSSGGLAISYKRQAG